MKSSTVRAEGTGPSRSRGGSAARARFVVAGLSLALALGVAAPMLARALPFGIEATTFAVAALCLVGLGYFVGGRVDALERTSLEDPVTRVGNRRHWEQRLAEEVTRAERSRMPLSLMVLDVDHLKELNDAQGHGCGDHALTLVGQVLLDTCRSRDVAARFGGDEFVVLLPRTRAFEARVVAERIRAGIVKQRKQHGPPLDPMLTVSIGVADLTAIDELRGQRLFEAADRALYVAKGAGRDRVEVARRPAPRTSEVIRLDDVRARRTKRRSRA
jgi:diguanylate cyclase (GGDEF)-like protein